MQKKSSDPNSYGHNFSSSIRHRLTFSNKYLAFPVGAFPLDSTKIASTSKSKASLSQSSKRPDAQDLLAQATISVLDIVDMDAFSAEGNQTSPAYVYIDKKPHINENVQKDVDVLLSDSDYHRFGSIGSLRIHSQPSTSKAASPYYPPSSTPKSELSHNNLLPSSSKKKAYANPVLHPKLPVSTPNAKIADQSQTQPQLQSKASIHLELKPKLQPQLDSEPKPHKRSDTLLRQSSPITPFTKKDSKASSRPQVDHLKLLLSSQSNLPTDSAKLRTQNSLLFSKHHTTPKVLYSTKSDYVAAGVSVETAYSLLERILAVDKPRIQEKIVDFLLLEGVTAILIRFITCISENQEAYLSDDSCGNYDDFDGWIDARRTEHRSRALRLSDRELKSAFNAVQMLTETNPYSKKLLEKNLSIIIYSLFEMFSHNAKGSFHHFSALFDHLLAKYPVSICFTVLFSPHSHKHVLPFPRTLTNLHLSDDQQDKPLIVTMLPFLSEPSIQLSFQKVLFTAWTGRAFSSLDIEPTDVVIPPNVISNMCQLPSSHASPRNSKILSARFHSLNICGFWNNILCLIQNKNSAVVKSAANLVVTIISDYSNYVGIDSLFQPLVNGEYIIQKMGQLIVGDSNIGHQASAVIQILYALFSKSSSLYSRLTRDRQNLNQVDPSTWSSPLLIDAGTSARLQLETFVPGLFATLTGLHGDTDLTSNATYARRISVSFPSYRNSRNRLSLTKPNDSMTPEIGLNPPSFGSLSAGEENKNSALKPEPTVNQSSGFYLPSQYLISNSHQLPGSSPSLSPSSTLSASSISERRQSIESISLNNPVLNSSDVYQTNQIQLKNLPSLSENRVMILSIILHILNESDDPDEVLGWVDLRVWDRLVYWVFQHPSNINLQSTFYQLLSLVVQSSIYLHNQLLYSIDIQSLENLKLSSSSCTCVLNNSGVCLGCHYRTALSCNCDRVMSYLVESIKLPERLLHALKSTSLYENCSGFFYLILNSLRLSIQTDRIEARSYLLSQTNEVGLAKALSNNYPNKQLCANMFYLFFGVTLQESLDFDDQSELIFKEHGHSRLSRSSSLSSKPRRKDKVKDSCSDKIDPEFIFASISGTPTNSKANHSLHASSVVEPKRSEKPSIPSALPSSSPSSSPSSLSSSSNYKVKPIERSKSTSLDKKKSIQSSSKLSKKLPASKARKSPPEADSKHTLKSDGCSAQKVASATVALGNLSIAEPKKELHIGSSDKHCNSRKHEKGQTHKLTGEKTINPCRVGLNHPTRSSNLTLALSPTHASKTLNESENKVQNKVAIEVTNYFSCSPDSPPTCNSSDVSTSLANSNSNSNSNKAGSAPETFDHPISSESDENKTPSRIQSLPSCLDMPPRPGTENYIQRWQAILLNNPVWTESIPLIRKQATELTKVNTNFKLSDQYRNEIQPINTHLVLYFGPLKVKIPEIYENNMAKNKRLAQRIQMLTGNTTSKPPIPRSSSQKNSDSAGIARSSEKPDSLAGSKNQDENPGTNTHELNQDSSSKALADPKNGGSAQNVQHMELDQNYSIASKPKSKKRSRKGLSLFSISDIQSLKSKNFALNRVGVDYGTLYAFCLGFGLELLTNGKKASKPSSRSNAIDIKSSGTVRRTLSNTSKRTKKKKLQNASSPSALLSTKSNTSSYSVVNRNTPSARDKHEDKAALGSAEIFEESSNDTSNSSTGSNSNSGDSLANSTSTKTVPPSNISLNDTLKPEDIFAAKSCQNDHTETPTVLHMGATYQKEVSADIPNTSTESDITSKLR